MFHCLIQKERKERGSHPDDALVFHHLARAVEVAPELLWGLGGKHVLVDQLVDPLLVLELLLAHHQQPDKTQSTPTLREGERERLFAGFFVCV